MIRVTLDFIPGSEESLLNQLSIVEIDNIGGLDGVYNYTVRAKDSTFMLKEFDRRRGVFDLVIESLKLIKDKVGDPTKIEEGEELP